MKKSNDTNTNRTRNFLASSMVSQPTLPPRAPIMKERKRKKKKTVVIGQHICYKVYHINPAFCDAVNVLLSTKEFICVSFRYSCIYMPSRGKIHKLQILQYLQDNDPYS